MADYSGTIFNDTQNGGAADEVFDFSQGGSDTLNGGGGQDWFKMGGELDPLDRIDGGDGSDTLFVGDLAAPVTLQADTIRNIEGIQFENTGRVSLALAEGNAGHFTYVYANTTQVSFDGSAVTSGDFVFSISGSANRLIGSQNGDTYATPLLDRKSIFDGSGGFDQMWIVSSLTFRAADHSFRSIESIRADFAVDLTFADGNVAAGETLYYGETTTAGVSQRIDGHKETDGHFALGGSDSTDIFIGGHLSDTLMSGGGDDTLKGGGGADQLYGGTGADWFVFSHVRDSWKGGFDVIHDLEDTDRIQLNGIDADKTQGGLQHFTLVEAFDGHAGQLTLSYDAGNDVTWLLGDVDGDGRAELRIQITGDHSDFTGLVLGGGA